MNAHQATILVLFNESDSFTFGEMISATGIVESVLKWNLEVLINVGLLTMDASTEGAALIFSRDSNIILNKDFQW